MTICVLYIHAQNANNASSVKMEYEITDSGIIIYWYNGTVCKNYAVQTQFIPNPVQAQQVAPNINALNKPKFITIHGNISYDFFYRSKIDTPFSQQNLHQHTERVWLDVVVKEKYPFKVGFTARQSNSPFFKDLLTMNLNFDQYGFNKIRKQDLLNRLNISKWDNPDLKKIDSALNEKLKRYDSLKNWVRGPEALQRIVEEREKVFFNTQRKDAISKNNAMPKVPVYQRIRLNNGQFILLNTDSLLALNKEAISITSDSYISGGKEDMFMQTDSLMAAKKENVSPKKDSSFTKYYKNKMAELTELEQSVATLNHRSDSLKRKITQDISTVKQSIYKAAGPKDLERIAKENGISDAKKDKLQSFLSNIKTFNIGRSMVDYTELTAQNIMLTGGNIEYNPSYYAAFAAGTIDYGFRDIFGRGIKQKKQHLILGRMGWGDKAKRAIILTIFNGRKNNYGGLLATDSTGNSSRLFGYSVETIIRKSDNTFFSAEVAKSTKSNNNPVQGQVNKADNLFKFTDNTNMGFNFKGQTFIAETDTRLSGFYRKTGEAFQSFSLFTYNTDQQAWQIRADQSLLKRKVNLTAMLRQNDFTNPLTDKTFKTSTVFKSLQLNIRVPHWPTINAGYYPGSQFYIVDNKTVRENVYYILNGSILQAYRIKDISMNSSFIYNRYFNKATDSGFVLYKGINYMLSQSVLIKKLQLEGNYSYNQQAGLNYYTLDANGDYSIKRFLKFGGGIKYNHVKGGKSYWGESIRLSADLKKLGGLQLHYEKSYLPTIQQTLYPVEIGRVGWYKIF